MYPLPSSPVPARSSQAALLLPHGRRHVFSQNEAQVFLEAAPAVWDERLDGATPSAIARAFDLPLGRVRSILAGTPPMPLDADPRLLTGKRAVWLSQSGGGLLESAPGAPYPFLLAFFPLRFSQALFRRALRAVERDVRARHGLALSVGRLNEPLPFALAHRFATTRGTPCWTVDAEGAVSVGTPAWTPPVLGEVPLYPESRSKPLT